MIRTIDILHISDWHCNEEQFERNLSKICADRTAPDFLVVSGDMIIDPMYFWINHDRAAKEQRQIWEQMVYAIQRVIPSVGGIVAVPGNHCWNNYAIPGVVESFDQPEGKAVEIDGVRFGGFRGVPKIGNPRFEWSHELENGAFNWIIAGLPTDIDVLVVHSPPHGVLDHVNSYTKGGRRIKESVGIPFLREWCEENPRLRAVCFGHIHEEGGKIKTGQNGRILYSNASLGYNWLNVVVGDDPAEYESPSG